MKKLLALILAAALALSLVACGGDSGAGDTNTPSGGNGDTTSTDTPSGGEDSTQEEPSELKVGDTITNDRFEFTLTSVDFTDKLNIDCYSEDFMLPYEEENEKGPSFAEEGYIWLIFSFTYKFIGRERFEDGFRTLGAPCVTYGDSYIFDGNEYYTRDDGKYGIYAKESNDVLWNILSNSKNIVLYRILGYEKNSNGAINGDPYISEIYEPLDKSIYECRGFISVPLEVYENTDEPLSISFNMFGGDFMIR